MLERSEINSLRVVNICSKLYDLVVTFLMHDIDFENHSQRFIVSLLSSITSQPSDINGYSVSIVYNINYNQKYVYKVPASVVITGSQSS